MAGNIQNKNDKKVKNFKSLYEVKDTYLPNKDLKSLERMDETSSKNNLIQIIEKIERSKQNHKP